jgi:hypothetical protein
MSFLSSELKHRSSTCSDYYSSREFRKEWTVKNQLKEVKLVNTNIHQGLHIVVDYLEMPLSGGNYTLSFCLIVSFRVASMV